MSITRRDLLAGSVLAVGAAACNREPAGADGGRAAGAQGGQGGPAAQRAQAAQAALTHEIDRAKGQKQILIRFEGMISPVVTALKSNPTVPVAVDFALLNVKEENPNSHPHPPTLAIPRPLLKHEPSQGQTKPLQLPPDIVDGLYAYWALRGVNVEFVPAGNNTPIKTYPEKLPVKTTEMAEPANPGDWNGLQWLPQMSQLYGTPISADWRKLPAVAAMIRLTKGSVVEPPYTASSFPPGDAPFGKYELYRKKGKGGLEETKEARLYKHFIRAAIDVTSGVAVKFYDRSTGTLKGTIDLHVLPGHETDILLRVANVPAEWRMPKKVVQEDTVAFGALYGIGDKDARWKSKYHSKANEETAEGCDCCSPQGAEETRDALPALDGL
jgi:hypothetical protein